MKLWQDQLTHANTHAVESRFSFEISRRRRDHQKSCHRSNKCSFGKLMLHYFSLFCFCLERIFTGTSITWHGPGSVRSWVFFVLNENATNALIALQKSFVSKASDFLGKRIFFDDVSSKNFAVVVVRVGVGDVFSRRNSVGHWNRIFEAVQNNIQLWCARSREGEGVGERERVLWRRGQECV